MSTKFVFVTGGVISSLGKGIFAASLAHLLKHRGLTVTVQKLDPYLNVDPGTMSPYQHGEVFVTDDGAETDLDIGHYERFLDQKLARLNSVSSGQIYMEVITRERRGDFLGRTVQVVPHVTDQIKACIDRAAKASGAQVVICEVGGTVGDIEGQPFLEAIRQFSWERGRENCMFCHVTLVPYMSTSGELKTKPTQHSVKELLSVGIVPDMIVCRAERRLTTEVKKKIGLFCNVPAEMVIESPTCRSIYEVPEALRQEGCAELVARRLDLLLRPSTEKPFAELLEHIQRPRRGAVRIAIVGKYTGHNDAYMSIHEALNHGALAHSSSIRIEYRDSEEIFPDAELETFDGVLVPGGFGDRGIEGKIDIIRRVRERGIPFLGICLGMQCAVIEFARNVLGLAGAHSSEFAEQTPHPVIHLMEAQREVSTKGATMRLGLYPAELAAGSRLRDLYGVDRIQERHRHRFEFNGTYLERFRERGLVPSAMSPDGRLVEAVELAGHPWFVGVQYHPEFLSRPMRAHPLFRGLVGAMLERRSTRSDAPQIQVVSA